MGSRNADKHVLVVEDHPPTAELLTTALEEADPSVSSSVVHGGSDCLAVLHGEDESMSYPDLVLLDLDLPDITGFVVLETRAENPVLCQIPTVVVSGRDDSETVLQCYEQGANGFISKPDDFDGYLSIAETVVQHWFSLAELPEKGTGGS